MVIVLLVTLAAGCTTAPTTADSRSTWSKPVQLGEPSPASGDTSLYGVSCPSSTFCESVDENGSAFIRRDGTWSKAQATGVGGTLTSVSCAAPTFCVAMSSGGNSVSFNGISWSTQTAVGPSATYRISCPTVTFCAAVGVSGTFGTPSTVDKFNGHSWSMIQMHSSEDATDRLMDLSCSTPTMCVGVNLDGHVLTFDGTTWTTSQRALTKGLLSVSCPSSSFCLAVAASGDYVTFDGQSWSTPSAIPGFQSGFAYAVSCGSVSACTVIGLGGRAVDWEQGRWSPPVLVFPGGAVASVSVSCANTTDCVAVNSNGSAASS